MADREFTKSEKKKLRALASEAHRRELAEHLRDLGSLFRDWEASRLDAFSLADAIHDFHDGANRDLYSLYNRIDPGFLVARGVARRLIDRREVPAALMKLLERQVGWFERNSEDEQQWQPNAVPPQPHNKRMQTDEPWQYPQRASPPARPAASGPWKRAARAASQRTVYPRQNSLATARR